MGARELDVRVRPYAGETDWWAVRALLVETFERTPPGRNWDARRWDGWRCYRERLLTDEELAGRVAVCETNRGRIVGAVHPEGTGDAYVDLDPDFGDCLPALLDWAEGRLAVPETNGRRRLDVPVQDDDERRIALVRRRGYDVLSDSGGWFRVLRLGAAPTVPALAEPYRLATTDSTPETYAAMAALLNAAFATSAHTPGAYRTFVELSPSFEHELSLVAVATDGSFAAHVALTYDAVNRHATVEPVCTDPRHRRQGLARALLLEGIRRVAERGAAIVTLDTGEEPAQTHLYESCGFTEAYHGSTWRRTR